MWLRWKQAKFLDGGWNIPLWYAVWGACTHSVLFCDSVSPHVLVQTPGMCSYTHRDLPLTPADENANQRKNGTRRRQQGQQNVLSHMCTPTAWVTNVRVQIIVFLWTTMFNLVLLMSTFTKKTKTKPKNNLDDVMQTWAKITTAVNLLPRATSRRTPLLKALDACRRIKR